MVIKFLCLESTIQEISPKTDLDLLLTKGVTSSYPSMNKKEMKEAPITVKTQGVSDQGYPRN